MTTERPVHVCGCAACRAGDKHSQREDHRQLNLLLSRLDEQQRRWVAAREAKRLAWRFRTGRGDHRPSSGDHPARSGRTRRRIAKSPNRPRPVARWRSCSSRKKHPTLIADLKRCVDPETAGNPCSDEKWVRSRLRGLSEKLEHRACPTTIGRLLRGEKYGLRSHRKVLHTGRSMRNATGSFTTSTSYAKRSARRLIRESAWTRKRRNSSASSRIRVKPGVRKRSRSTITTSPGESFSDFGDTEEDAVRNSLFKLLPECLFGTSTMTRKFFEKSGRSTIACGGPLSGTLFARRWTVQMSRSLATSLQRL